MDEQKWDKTCVSMVTPTSPQRRKTLERGRSRGDGGRGGNEGARPGGLSLQEQKF